MVIPLLRDEQVPVRRPPSTAHRCRLWLIQGCALEVAPMGETLEGAGSGQLVERKALRSGADELDARPMRDLKRAPISTPRSSSSAMASSRSATRWTSTGWSPSRCPARSNAGGSGLRRTMATLVSNASIANTSSATHPIGEVLQIGCHVPAG
jgi:hypothetical protein